MIEVHPFKCGICKNEFGEKPKLQDHIRNEHAKEKRNVLILTFLVIMIAYSIIVIYFVYTKSSTQDIFEILKYGLILLAIGFLLCALRYSHVISNMQKLPDRSEWFLIFLNSYDEKGKSLEDEKKSKVFSIIFGFLASLAITGALGTYYEHFIDNLPLSTFFSLQDILNVDLIPTLRLVIFFVIAIPLTHSGYRFLSNLIINNLSINKWNKKKNDISGLIAIFIISIVQVSFLFFLGQSVVIIPESYQITQENENTSSQNTKPETQQEKTNSLFIYVFWLTLTMSMASVGAGLVKIIIKNNRIPLEWIFLNAIVVGFLISITVLIPIKGPLHDEEISILTVTVFSVLTARSVLDYFIGQHIYFEPDTKSTPL